MIRKYNYTNRKKIPRDNISIHVESVNNLLQFDCKFNLEDLNFPPDAKVYVEPYYRTNFMRFYFGNVNEIETPKNTKLIDFVGLEWLYFRIKVVDSNCRIIGFISGIKSTDTDESKLNKLSILHVQFEELGQKLYDLHFEEEFPVLEVNKRIKSARDIVKSDVFITTIYPSVIKEVAQEIINDDDNWSESDECWQGYWIQFFKNILKVTNPIPNKLSEAIEKTEYLREVTDSFCNLEKVRQKFERLNIL